MKLTDDRYHELGIQLTYGRVTIEYLFYFEPARIRFYFNALPIKETSKLWNEIMQALVEEHIETHVTHTDGQRMIEVIDGFKE